MCTGPRLAAQSSPAARPGRWFRRFLSTPHPVEIPLPGRLPAPDPPRTWGGGWGRRRRGTQALAARGQVRGRGAQIRNRAGARRLRIPKHGAAGPPHSPLAMSSGSGPGHPDILQHRRYPRPCMVPRRPSVPQPQESDQGPTSPLCLLEELTDKTFHGLGGPHTAAPLKV